MSNLCECGCGQPTRLASKTDSKRGWIKGKPLRFINGHNNVHEGKPNSKITKICVVCGKNFEVWPSQANAIHCSNDCGRITVSEKLVAPEGHTRKTSTGYTQMKISDHPYADGDGYVMYHRYVMEQKLGHYISKDFDVHHKDGNIENNDPNNLDVLTRSAHMSLHAKERRFWELSLR